MKHILFIINPNAGTKRMKEIEQSIVRYLDLTRYYYQIIFTEYPRHGREIAKEAVLEGADVIISVGGDGSLHDIIQSVVGTSIIIGVWPLGSGNGLARSMGIPFKDRKVIEMINNMKVQSIDVGWALDEYFIATLGIGFDAHVTQLFQKSKTRGLISYVKYILQSVFTFAPLEVMITENDLLIYKGKAFIVNVANVPQLGYGFEIAPLALWDDQQFELTILEKVPFVAMLPLTLKAFTKKIHQSKFVKRFKIREVNIHVQGVDGLQMDGEYIHKEKNEDHVEIKIRPKAIRMLVG